MDYGFNVFHRDSVKDTPYIPPVVFTAFKRYNTDEAEENPSSKKAFRQSRSLPFRTKTTFKFFGASRYWRQL
jgi:hypothetical protein